jgi:hypothetical protein
MAKVSRTTRRKSMAENVKDLLAESNAAVPNLSPTEAGEKIRSGNVPVVDVRYPTGVQQSGRLKVHERLAGHAGVSGRS